MDGDSLAAHAELWRPGWEVDGFRDESGDVWEVEQVSEMFFYIIWEMHLLRVPLTDVMQIVTSGWLEGLMDGDSALIFAKSKI